MSDEVSRLEDVHHSNRVPIPAEPIERWILSEGPNINSDVELFDELCWRLLGNGIPLWRATLHLGTLHPQIRSFGLRWWRERKVVEQYVIAHGSEVTDEYLRNSIRATIERG